MTIAKITGQGLTSIAIVVGLLWACIIGERVVAGRAADIAVQTMQAARRLQLRQRREPAVGPLRQVRRAPKRA